MKRLYIDATTTKERTIQREINAYLKIAKDRGYKLPKDIGYKLTAKFDITSIRFAGQAQKRPATKDMVLRFHKKALEKYGKKYIDSVVAHEVAHIIQYANGKSSPHGRTFKQIMRMFKADDSRTHTFDLRSLSTSKSVKRNNKQKIAYSCGCFTHMVSPLIHRRMMLGQERRCGRCKGRLVKK